MAGEHVEQPELPEELIHHIQSLLDAKHAVRTSVLSKLWYCAWSTNPILSLDTSIEQFAECENFAWTTINRFRNFNLKLNTFKLILRRYGDYYDKFARLADELIPSSLTLGVDDLHVEYLPVPSNALPEQVFSSKYLKKLYVYGGKIDLPPSNGKPRVLCSRLVSLELIRVRVSDDMMRDILLGCPLMEYVRVVKCDGLEKINLSSVRGTLRTFHSARCTALLVEWDENCAPESRVNLQQQYHNLISLVLKGVKLDNLFFELFSHRFPSLERLDIGQCRGPVTIHIESNSLRYLSLDRIDGLKFAKVQTPNIQMFKLETADIPASLSFLKTPNKWKSDLRFYQRTEKDKDIKVSWLLKIRDILTELSLSKISIAIYLSGDDHHIGSIPEKIIQSNHISPFVENLKLNSRTWHQNSFGWFLCCRPKYLNCFGFSNRHSYEMLELAYNELKKHEIKNLTDALPCIHGLEEVEMEHYDRTLTKWRPVRQGTEEAAHEGGEFRLRLKWTKKRLRSMLL